MTRITELGSGVRPKWRLAIVVAPLCSALPTSIGELGVVERY